MLERGRVFRAEIYPAFILGFKKRSTLAPFTKQEEWLTERQNNLRKFTKALSPRVRTHGRLPLAATILLIVVAGVARKDIAFNLLTLSPINADVFAKNAIVMTSILAIVRIVIATLAGLVDALKWMSKDVERRVGGVKCEAKASEIDEDWRRGQNTAAERRVAAVL